MTTDTPRTKGLTGTFYLRCDDCPQPHKCESMKSVHPDDCADTERDLAECRAAMRELSPLVRKVLRTVDAWNLDPDKPMQHPFTELANQARAILAKGEGK